MPFFAAEQIRASLTSSEDALKSPEEQKCNERLLEIQKVSFVMDDLRLYLDTHPDDLDALAMLKRVHPRYLLQQSNFSPKEMQLRT
ncbi:spore coat protein CotJB [Sellimonas intestinalis]|uniref:spore coat protein CotJB n=1 Tax=Sellimonas intestinalis TaxID=1653434 RepID=UPI0039954351